MIKYKCRGCGGSTYWQDKFCTKDCAVKFLVELEKENKRLSDLLTQKWSKAFQSQFSHSTKMIVQAVGNEINSIHLDRILDFTCHQYFIQKDEIKQLKKEKKEVLNFKELYRLEKITSREFQDKCIQMKNCQNCGIYDVGIGGCFRCKFNNFPQYQGEEDNWKLKEKK
jgi:hypothetical protein